MGICFGLPWVFLNSLYYLNLKNKIVVLLQKLKINETAVDHEMN